jgi:hypothetical protein
MRLLILALSLFAISGCISYDYTNPFANLRLITYDSSPQGASLICNGEVKGYTPTSLYYEISMKDTDDASISPESCTAKWASGTSASYDVSPYIRNQPANQRYIAQRPDVEGYLVDAEFSLKVEQLNYAKQQAAAAKQQAEATEKISKKKRKIVIKDDGIIKRCRMGGTC